MLYFIHYPRDFANEYEIFVVSQADSSRLVDRIPSARRITRKQAIERGITRPRMAKKFGEQWFGGFRESDSLPVYSGTLDEILTSCIQGTLEAIEYQESMASTAVD